MTCERCARMEAAILASFHEGDLKDKPADRPENSRIDTLLNRSARWWNDLPPIDRALHLMDQRQSWNRGEMALGREERKTTIIGGPR